MKKVAKKQNLIKKGLFFLDSPVFLGTAMCAVILGFLLFGPHLLGYGDNGRFYRVLVSNGLAALPGQDYSNFFNRDYGLLRYFNENAPVFFSSQTLFVQVALFLNKVFFSTRLFDIRFLGAVYYVCYIGGIALLLQALTHSKRNLKNYGLMLLVVLVLSDSAYGLYFNSFYPDAVTLISVVYIFASFLLLLRPDLKYRFFFEVLCFVNIFILLTAKEQNYLLLAGILIFSIVLVVAMSGKKRKILFSCLIGLTVLLGGVSFTANFKNEQNVIKYSTVTKGILQTQPDRSQALRRAGISQQYALMAGEDYYPTDYVSVAPNSKQVKRDFVSKIHYAWVMQYYVTHPQKLRVLLDISASDLMQTRVKSVGNYPKSKQKAMKQTKYFNLFSFWFEKLYPPKYAFNLMLTVTLLLVYSVGFYNDRQRGSSVGGLKLALATGILLNVLILPLGLIILQGNMNLAQDLLPAALSMQLLLLLLISDSFNDSLWSSQKE